MSSRSAPRRVPHCVAALVVGLVMGGVAPAVIAAPRAFPGAEGFGALVTGGRGAKVVHVSNLNDSGAGSLREAISAGNRTVVFDVGGVITIRSQLVVAGDNVTIAGQTAPGRGVTVYGDGTSASGRKNVIIRYLRLRQGIDSESGTKALNVTDGASMIFDHLSVQWGRWDTIGLTGNTSSVTIQYSLLGESIDPQRFGGLVDSADKITLSHNLWLDSQSRSPKFKANGQYVNNVVYNWGGNGLGGGHSSADWYEDIINNLFIKGPSSTGGFVTGYAATDRVFDSGNLVDLEPDGRLSGRAVVPSDFQGDSPPTFETAAHNVPPVAVTVESASAAYESVVAHAGASLCRDAVDQRLLGHVTSLGTMGAIVVDENAVGGQPIMDVVSRPVGFDSDGDGMPDAWEAAHGLNAGNASDGADDADNDGYTNLEDYLNALAGAGPNSCGAGGGMPDGGTDSPVDVRSDGGDGDASVPDGAAPFDAPIGNSDSGPGDDVREDQAVADPDASGGEARDARADLPEGTPDANAASTGGRGETGSGGAGGAAVPKDGASGGGSGATSPGGGGCSCHLAASSPHEPWISALLWFALVLVAQRSRPRAVFARLRGSSTGNAAAAPTAAERGPAAWIRVELEVGVHRLEAGLDRRHDLLGDEPGMAIGEGVGSDSRPRSLPMLSPPPFGTAMMMEGGNFRMASAEMVRFKGVRDLTQLPGAVVDDEHGRRRAVLVHRWHVGLNRSCRAGRRPERRILAGSAPRAPRSAAELG